MNKKPQIAAFTLIELLTVIVIMAILAGILLPAITVVLRKAAIAKAESTIGSLESALSMYYSDYGMYPRSSVDVTQNNLNVGSPEPGINLVNALTKVTAYSKGAPYVKFKENDLNSSVAGNPVLLDPWGNAYVYVSRRYGSGDGQLVSGSGPFHPDTSNTDNNTYNIYSFGPDGKTYGGVTSTTDTTAFDGSGDGNSDANDGDSDNDDDINNW